MAASKKDIISTDTLLEIFTKKAILHPRPIAIITMGIPGSGKSTVVKKFIEKNLHKKFPRDKKYKKDEFVNCNPDEILPHLPELPDKEKLGLASRKNASLIKKIREAKDKLSIIYDGTGANFPAYKGVINKLLEQGYFPILIYVRTNMLIAKNRVKKRSRKVKSQDIERIENALNQPIYKNRKKFDFYRNMVLGSEGIYAVIDNTFKGKITETNFSGLEI